MPLKYLSGETILLKHASCNVPVMYQNGQERSFAVSSNPLNILPPPPIPIFSDEKRSGPSFDIRLSICLSSSSESSNLYVVK